METKRYRVRLNSADKLEELLQETYDQACKQINEIQNEINKLINSSNLGADGVSMDEKTKYASAMHNYIEDKRKALVVKLDIAKFLGEVMKHNGNAAEAINEKGFTKRTSLKLDDLKAAIDSSDEDVDTYNIKKN